MKHEKVEEHSIGENYILKYQDKVMPIIALFSQ